MSLSVNTMNTKIKTRWIFIFLSVLLVFDACSLREREIDSEPGTPGEPRIPAAIAAGNILETGVASWYGDDFNGKRTASGEIYDMDKLTAAHKTLPFNTIVIVENLDNGKKVMVRINDRGPFVKERIIDLSRRAAKLVGIYDIGTANVRIRTAILPGRKMKSIPVIQHDTDLTEKTLNQEPQKMPEPLPVTVTPPVPVTAAVTVPQDTITQDTCYLQAGAFSSRKNAERILTRINNMLPDASSMFRVEFKDGFYKVLTGKLDSLDSAEKLKKRLKDIGIDSIIK
jgi:rare lipoprotein A